MDKQEKIPQLKESFQYFKRFLLLVKPYWHKIIKGLSLGLIIGLIGMITPLLTKMLIDKVYPSEDVSLMQCACYWHSWYKRGQYFNWNATKLL